MNDLWIGKTKIEEGALYHIEFAPGTKYQSGWEMLGQYTGWTNGNLYNEFMNRILHFVKLAEISDAGKAGIHPEKYTFQVPASRFQNVPGDFIIRMVPMDDVPLYVGFDHLFDAYDRILKECNTSVSK